MLTCGRSRSSANVKRNKQDETFVILTMFCCRDRRYLVGEQLRWEVQHWLSPPDPSMNQNFVRKARHKGTASWFFESSILREWNAKGSFLWIHGKRRRFRSPTGSWTNRLLILSGGGEKYASVCHGSTSLFKVIHNAY